jgi:6-phosphofructokinase
MTSGGDCPGLSTALRAHDTHKRANKLKELG